MAGHFPWGASLTSAKWCLGKFMRRGKAAPHLCPTSPCQSPRALLTDQTLRDTLLGTQRSPLPGPFLQSPMYCLLIICITVFQMSLFLPQR